MKLKDVTQVEDGYTKEFNFWSNRFYLFDKLGRELNRYAMEDVPDVLEIEVIEIKRSSYSGWGVGFPTTHIMLDFLDDTALCLGHFHFGDYDTRE